MGSGSGLGRDGVADSDTTANIVNTEARYR